MENIEQKKMEQEGARQADMMAINNLQIIHGEAESFFARYLTADSISVGNLRIGGRKVEVTDLDPNLPYKRVLYLGDQY